MGGSCSSSRALIPGYFPDHPGKPSLEEDYKEKGIQEAYKKAGKEVGKKNCTFCTIGPDEWLRCWQVASDSKTKFMTTKKNVMLYIPVGKPLKLEKSFSKNDFDKYEELVYLSV